MDYTTEPFKLIDSRHYPVASYVQSLQPLLPARVVSQKRCHAFADGDIDFGEAGWAIARRKGESLSFACQRTSRILGDATTTALALLPPARLRVSCRDAADPPSIDGRRRETRERENDQVREEDHQDDRYDGARRQADGEDASQSEEAEGRGEDERARRGGEGGGRRTRTTTKEMIEAMAAKGYAVASIIGDWENVAMGGYVIETNTDPNDLVRFDQVGMSVVPEPNSAVLCVVGIAPAFGIRRWCRKRRAAVSRRQP